MLTRGYERFSVLLDPICSTRFLEHVKLAVCFSALRALLHQF